MIKKLNKKPLKNSTFQLKCNHSEMLKKHFLTVVVLPGKHGYQSQSPLLECAAQIGSILVVCRGRWLEYLTQKVFLLSG